LLYALGEIILVVIGILIALQINNWNEYEKGYQKSKVFLSEIREDLVSDSLYLSRAIRMMEEQIVYEEWALAKSSYQETDIDSLKAIFKNQYWDFYLNDRTFQKIQNAPESNLVGFDSIYRSISDYYTVTRQRMEKNTAAATRETESYRYLFREVEQLIEVEDSYFKDYSGFNLNINYPALDSQPQQQQAFLIFMAGLPVRNFIKRSYARRLFMLLFFKRSFKQTKSLLEQVDQRIP
jgi:hypothetical protein